MNAELKVFYEDVLVWRGRRWSGSNTCHLSARTFPLMEPDQKDKAEDESHSTNVGFPSKPGPEREAGPGGHGQTKENNKAGQDKEINRKWTGCLHPDQSPCRDPILRSVREGGGR